MTENTSGIQWYIARDGNQHGPLTELEMKLFVDGGHLRPTDLIWRPGFEDWRPAQTVFPPAEQAPSQQVQPKQPAAPTTAPQGQRHSDPAQQTAATAGSASGAQGQTSRPESQAYHQPHTGPSAGRGEPNRQSPQDYRQQPNLDPASPSSNLSKERSLSPLDHDLEDDDAPSWTDGLGWRLGAAGLILLVAGGAWYGIRNPEQIAGLTRVFDASSVSATEDPPLVTAQPQETQTASVETSENTTGTLQSPSEQAVPTPEPTPAPAPITNMTDPNVIVPTYPAPEPADPPAAAGSTTTANLAPQTPPNQAASGDKTIESIDAEFQKSPLWKILKAEFPAWYKERVSEVAEMSTTQNETEVSRHLLTKLVGLRRQHANEALAASTPKLRNVASAFLENLKSLASHSTDTCYKFISKGELSPAVVELMNNDGYRGTIENQVAAVFEAIADGRRTATKRTGANKSDYDALATKLTEMGWTQQDLQLFANPKALANAPPDQVCKMVQDWFAAHIAISDQGMQERLLYETLRPVVAG